VVEKKKISTENSTSNHISYKFVAYLNERKFVAMKFTYLNFQC